MISTRTPLACLAALSFALVACSGGGEIDEGSTTPQGSTAGAGGSAAGAAGAQAAGGSQAAGAAGKATSGGAAGAAGGAAGATGGAGGKKFSTPEELEDYLDVPRSCAYRCGKLAECAENTQPYPCPAAAPWAELPHAATCGDYDGTLPTPTQGKCTVTDPEGDAIARPRKLDESGSQLLPGGREEHPFGVEHIFDEGIAAGLSVFSLRIPGTDLVAVVDAGNGNHAVRIVDAKRIGSAEDPVVSFVEMAKGEVLNGSATFANNHVYVASDTGKVEAFALDPATFKLTRDADASLALKGDKENYYVGALAATPDGKTLVVAPVELKIAYLFDIDPASPSYKQVLAELNLGAREVFGVYIDPADPAHAYLSLWDTARVLELDISNPAAPALGRTFDVDRNPQGVAFLDARFMAVANDLGDSISLIDRTAGTVTNVPVELDPDLPGLDVSTLTYDAPRKRLYATLAAIDAVAAYDVDLSTSPPTLTAAGHLPASWWPVGVVAHDDGSLTVTNMRGGMIGPLIPTETNGSPDGDDQMRGSVQKMPLPSAQDLEAGSAAVRKAVAIGERTGYPRIECPDGAADFPLPATNTEGPSKVIKHIFFVVRENKTFDAIFGDMPGVEGDPKLIMKATTEEQEMVWPNIRQLGRSFAIGDNFYNVAVKSTQGHQWTTYGRTTDFCERTWGIDSRPIPLCGVGQVGKAKEGSLFDWLDRGGVAYDVLGEVVGNPVVPAGGKSRVDSNYPGGPVQSISYPDIEKACYTGARARIFCDLGSFVYMTLPNDHTVGVSPQNPSDETMIAHNDEATGLFVDLISHSPIWHESLIVITEDDPQQGLDHVDYHRTPLVMISPWVRRGYVSKTHVDVASLFKVFAHLLGQPYPNVIVKNAGLPADWFTSTPDYTPYSVIPRKWPLACGAQATWAETQLTESWDFSHVDEQPGLGAQTMRWMRGKQLTTLTPELKAQIAKRKAMKAAGVRDDDD